jgi:predicted nuclease of predicted toxin-antitoxin system
MKLKLDENLSRHLKPMLTLLEHNVLTAADEGLLSQSDVVVARASMAEGRMLLTLDLEFGDLRKHPPGNHPGIVLFRPRSYGPLSVNRFVEEFIRETDLSELEGCVVLVEPKRVRVRRPPLDTSGKEWEEI